MLPAGTFDIALMVGRVVRYFVEESEREAVAASCVAPCGRLVLDSRGPAGEGRCRRDTGDSPRRLRLPDGSTVPGRTRATEVSGPLVTAVHHSLFDDGERLTTGVIQRFLPGTKLHESPHANGFDPTAIHGGRHREPVGHPTGEPVVHAVRR